MTVGRDARDVTNSSELPGVPDVQTVTPQGVPTLSTIDGVIVRQPITHVDHRGALFEIYNGDPVEWPEPAVYVYQTSVFPGQIKGWARHEVKVDRYTLASGELLVLLYDGRPGSATEGVLQRVMLSPRAARQITIPVGVWHMIINLGSDEAQLVNLPTERYHHDKPDRILLPWDTDELPVDVRAYLPKF
jgi:dTDP-4-dehydrorhamnose 3,5-epimerase